MRNGTTMNGPFCGRIGNASPPATPAARKSLRIDPRTTNPHTAALTACAISASRVEYHISDDPNQIAIVAAAAAQIGQKLRATAYPVSSKARPHTALAATAAAL